MIREYKTFTPKVEDTCFVADTAMVIGRTVIGEDSNIWFGAVLRGDVNTIEIGKRTNIQDNSVVHVADGFNTVIGDDVTVGHSAIVHGCHVGNNVLIGMGAIVLDGAKIGDNVMIGAGALIPPGKEIPSGSLVVGSPGKVKRALTEEEIQGLKSSAEKYVNISKDYL